MEVKSQIVNTSFIFFILLAFRLSLGAPTNTWVGSKYQIECTMCAACDNPCNQQPPPALPLSPPPPSTGGGGGYYYSPPPPSSGTGGGYYYAPPPPSQSVYFNYPPPPYQNYPTPGPPDPIMGNYPYYYHNSPQSITDAGVSLSGATAMLRINILFCIIFL